MQDAAKAMIPLGLSCRKCQFSDTLFSVLRLLSVCYRVLLFHCLSSRVLRWNLPLLILFFVSVHLSSLSFSVFCLSGPECLFLLYSLSRWACRIVPASRIPLRKSYEQFQLFCQHHGVFLQYLVCFYATITRYPSAHHWNWQVYCGKSWDLQRSPPPRL